MALTILHVLVPEPPGEMGGADMHVLDLATEQAKLGHRPIITERGSPEFAGRAADLGLEVRSASGRTFREAIRMLGAWVSASRPDIVHAHGYDADYWAIAAMAPHRSPLRGRPLVLTQHGVIEDTLWHRAKTAADAICARFADGIIVCSERLLPRMRAWCPRGRVAYIPNGVREVAAMPTIAARAVLAERFGVPPGVPLAGYVGRLSAEKRPDRALSVVRRLRAHGHPVHLLIAGSGQLRPELERQAARLGIAAAVTFTGLVHDLGAVYGGLGALLLLSDTEGTSRVVAEALTAGVPVVASAVGGTPEQLGHGRFGYLVAPGDEAAAAAALQQAFASPASFISAAAAYARSRFSAEAMTGAVVRFYRSLLTQPEADIGQ